MSSPVHVTIQSVRLSWRIAGSDGSKSAIGLKDGGGFGITRPASSRGPLFPLRLQPERYKPRFAMSLIIGRLTHGTMRIKAAAKLIAATRAVRFAARSTRN